MRPVHMDMDLAILRILQYLPTHLPYRSSISSDHPRCLVEKVWASAPLAAILLVLRLSLLSCVRILSESLLIVIVSATETRVRATAVTEQAIRAIVIVTVKWFSVLMAGELGVKPWCCLLPLLIPLSASMLPPSQCCRKCVVAMSCLPVSRSRIQDAADQPLTMTSFRDASASLSLSLTLSTFYFHF